MCRASSCGGLRKVNIYLLRFLFVTEAIDGVEVGCHSCRIIAEEQPHADGDREANRHPQIRNRCGNGRHQRTHQRGYDGPDQDAESATDEGEDYGFQQKLQTYIPAASADSLAYSYFLRALGHGYEHHVHHSYATDQQTYRTDHRREDHQRAGKLIPQIAQKVG